MLALFALALLAQQASVPSDIAFEREMAAYRDQTRSRVACNAEADPGEVVVCASRLADGYRVPLIATNTGERDNIGAFEAREALLRQPNACETKVGATPYGCGHFGVTMTTSSRGTRLVQRPPTPEPQTVSSGASRP